MLVEQHSEINHDYLQKNVQDANLQYVLAHELPGYLKVLTHFLSKLKLTLLYLKWLIFRKRS